MQNDHVFYYSRFYLMLLVCALSFFLLVQKIFCQAPIGLYGPNLWSICNHLWNIFIFSLLHRPICCHVCSYTLTIIIRVCAPSIENVTLDDGIQLHARQLLYTVKIV